MQTVKYLKTWDGVTLIDVPKATFGERLRMARRFRSMSREELADRMGVTLRTISRWENDAVEPRRSSMAFAARLLNVPVFWMLDIDPEDDDHAWPAGPDGRPYLDDDLMQDLPVGRVTEGYPVAA